MGSGSPAAGSKRRGLKPCDVPPILRRVIDEESDLPDVDERATAAFKRWDVDNNGELTVEELLLVLRNLGLKIAMHDLKMAFNSADADLDGRIGLDDFRIWLYPDSFEQQRSITAMPSVDDADGYEGPLLLLLHSAAHLPSMDTFSESDPYATAYVSKGNRQFGPAIRWPFSWNCPNPQWNLTRDLGCHFVGSGADAGNRLHLELWDHDSTKKDSLIGSVDLRLMDLVAERWYEMQLGKNGRPVAAKCANSTAPSVRFMIIRQAPLVKQVFLIRHGESLWNKAQREHNVAAMLEQVDHALSQDGLKQCHDLEGKINEMMTIEPERWSDTEKDLANAEVVLSSPLTRAIQTALVGVSPILQRTRSLRLCRNARERRSRGGRDTTGMAMGEVEITSRVRLSFAGAGEDADKIARYTRVGLDATEAADRWWNSSKESASAVRERMDEFLAQLRFMREERIVVVGHSHFFRALIQQRLRPDANIYGVHKEQLITKKLMNCGILKLTLDFNYGRDRPITAAELVLDSELV